MTRGPSVLIIDDDPGVRRLVRRELTTVGYQVQDVEPGHHAFERLANRHFDLLILDIDAPASGGPKTIRLVRELSPIPILALSIRGDENTTVQALDYGADDDIRKPFSPRELFARVKNALRRKAREEGRPVRVATGDLEIDLLHRIVRFRGDRVHLAMKPYEVLRVLAEAA